MMKNFSLSTILGLVFGVSLVAYAVFAYTPPTQAPPGGNVSSPINTGTSDQTKTGGLLSVFDLWVDSVWRYGRGKFWGHRAGGEFRFFASLRFFKKRKLLV